MKRRFEQIKKKLVKQLSSTNPNSKNSSPINQLSIDKWSVWKSCFCWLDITRTLSILMTFVKSDLKSAQTKWNGSEVSQNLGTFFLNWGDFRFSSGSGRFTLKPVFASEMKDSRIVMHSIASLSGTDQVMLAFWPFWPWLDMAFGVEKAYLLRRCGNLWSLAGRLSR